MRGLIVALCALSVSQAVAAQEYVLDRERELRLAMSAGPLNVSSEADVYLFGTNGFERVVDGTNGFACMVIRVAEQPEFLAPHCFSPDAVRTVLPAKLAEGRMIAAGRSRPEVEAGLLAAFESGRLPLPEGRAYAYMMSSGQALGSAGSWLPHFMLYVPYATNESVGGTPGDVSLPFVGPETDHPHSTMVIVMREFVDPADVVLPSGSVP